MRDAMERYKKECKLRKQLYNQLIELRGNIRVFCRVRPLFGKEVEEEEEDVTRFPEEDEITVLASDGSYSRAKTYEFDKVFQPDSSQTAVFEEVAPLIASVLDGYNFCIFAYGQTGSGKTHTMEGPREDPGVNTRAIAELFRLAEERGRTTRSLSAQACWRSTTSSSGTSWCGTTRRSSRRSSPRMGRSTCLA